MTLDNEKQAVLELLDGIARRDRNLLERARRCLTSKGAEYQNEYLLRFDFEDGRIREAWEQTDTNLCGSAATDGRLRRGMNSYPKSTAGVRQRVRGMGQTGEHVVQRRSDGIPT